MDRLQAMSAFVAVVETGGFARAARRLGLSPPVVTRAVAELEEHLKLRLLTRTTRVVRVTEAGAQYAEDCRRILAEIEHAEGRALGGESRPQGRLVLTAPQLFGHLYVTPVVVAYLQRWPEVDVTCLFQDRVTNLLEENIDVAVRIGELPDSSLKAVRLGRVRRIVVGAPAYFERHGRPRRPEDLSAHTIVSNGAPASYDWRFVDGGRASSLRMRPRLHTSTNDSAIAAAAAGFGITRVLSYQAAPLLAGGALEIVLAEFEAEPWPVHVVHGPGRRPPAKVKAFVEAAVEMLRGHPALA